MVAASSISPQGSPACNPVYSAYASMKGAIEVFTKYLAKELGARKIAANMVAPGIIETDFTKDAFEAHPELDNTCHPLRRWVA